MKQLSGIHHVTAITSSAEKIYQFFTNVLGVRLVKKTVNQDDIQTYHLFFADDLGSAGTDMTFFDFQGIGPAIKGSNEISRTGFRVPSDAALEYWVKRFIKYQVVFEPIKELFGKKIIFFQDFDLQEYALVSDEHNQGIASGTPWHKGPVPDEFAITGLGPIFFRVSSLSKMESILSSYLFMRKTKVEGNYTLYEMGTGGNGASVILDFQPDEIFAQQGYGGIHHVAFRIDDVVALQEWTKHLNEIGASNSGLVDRFYFQSLYTRMHRGFLFEFATEGPGFIDDEDPYETLGELLALPPKLRNQRAYIEKQVRHIDTIRSNKVFEKEYL